MSNEASVVELARTIRPYLPDLLPADSAAELDRRLAGLLAAADERRIDTEILELLREPDLVRRWAALFLEDGLPPDVAMDRRVGVVLPGRGEAVAPGKFVCPQGDLVFYRRAVGQSVPLCPTHGVLVPAS
ncbi:hypothetical protein [Streptomyces sp. H39-S7]|uniref:hypothetical protein n=1 Tax=Streptomyces sp. H39-S7 TaxID=3004357 RepID=UPI0022AE75F4|nr:hypothetical protein [Streptomyces sp. H39-S7]MCZ4125846.1 hypothetical protein [Streptomyces sp. H39-S7]